MRIKITVIVLLVLSLSGFGQEVQLNGTNDSNFVNKNGNIGIGLPNPQTKLDIYGNNNPVRLRILGGSSNSNSATINLGVVKGRDWEINAKKFYSPEGYSLNFNHNSNDFQGPVTFSWMSNEKFRITPKGNIGIGTNSPTNMLEIGNSGHSGYALSTRTSTYGVVIQTEADKTNNSAALWIRGNVDSSPNELFRVQNNGNVSIGRINPEHKLDIYGNNKPVTLRILGGSTNSNSAAINVGVVDGRDWEIKAEKYMGSDGYAMNFNYKANEYKGPVKFSWANEEKIRITPEGNLGIGTKSPQAKLDLIGDLKIGNGANYESLLFKTGSNISGYNGVFEIKPSTIPGSGTARYMTYFKNSAHSNGKTEHHVTIEGNLGIGTTSPTEKLSVNGSIRSKEVKVEASPWPDYVFTAAYDLPTLEEVQNHINTKGHLPNIPSAKEVAENGIALGEMNAKLLEKIEELTLYTLEQERKLSKQQQEIKTLKDNNKDMITLKNKNKTLEARLAKIEKMLNQNNK